VPGRKEERFATELPIRLEGGEGVAHNVSANGIYFVTDAALKVGQPVKFTLEFANFPSGPIAVNCVARVVRLEERGASRGVGASISSFEFHRIARGKSSN
jgi:PilZ domain